MLIALKMFPPPPHQSKCGSQGNLIKWKLSSYSRLSFPLILSLSLFTCTPVALAYCSCLSVFCLLSIPFSSCFSLSPPLLPLPVGKLIYRPSAIVNHSLSCTLGAGVGVGVSVGVAAPPFFFDTIKFPCRLILNARRILIIFIENAL